MNIYGSKEGTVYLGDSLPLDSDGHKGQANLAASTVIKEKMMSSDSFHLSIKQMGVNTNKSDKVQTLVEDCWSCSCRCCQSIHGIGNMLQVRHED